MLVKQECRITFKNALSADPDETGIVSKLL